MLYKIINGGLSCPPETLRIDGKIITNFDKNKGQQKKYGYKELKEVDVPEYNLETEYIEVIRYEYTEDGKYIIPVYEVKRLEDKPVEPPAPKSEIEVIKELLDITHDCLVDLYDNPSKNNKPKEKPQSLQDWKKFNEPYVEPPVEEPTVEEQPQEVTTKTTENNSSNKK